ncbi:hypothetical protein HED60_04435 [Planctomycetales bacterium ZRK34]|nr:hypothetical protein HED60_04435 [Planctomycetales bacterium ZRK34]
MTPRITAILIDEHAATIIAAEGDRIERHPVAIDAEAPPQQQIAECIRAIGSHDSEIVLAIPSMWCQAAAVEIGNKTKRSDEALGYRLEEYLPIAAEDFVADFAPCSSEGESTPEQTDSPDSEDQDDLATRSRRLGVCVPISKLELFIHELENEGIHIGWICPAAMLVGQQATDTDSHDTDTVTFAINGHTDILITHAGAPTGWYIAPNQPDEIKQILQAENLDTAANIDDPCAHIGTCATQIATGNVQPWINLRRGPLAVGDSLRSVRRPLIALLVAVVLFMLCSAGVMLWRAQSYNQLANNYYARQLELLKTTLPGQRVLAAPRLQLTSEHKRLAGVRGSDDAPDLTASSLDDLVRLLESLPIKLRFRLLELRLDPDRIIIDGQARSHSDADAIAKALRQRGQFNVAPPRTQALKDGGVSFVLQISGNTKP